MSEPFLGEIRVISSNFAPQGWAFCNGQLLPIMQNQALYSILGTTYGGDGTRDFALPDLRGRTPFHAGSNLALGQAGGEESQTLVAREMASHTHAAVGSSNLAGQANPANTFWAKESVSAYAPGADSNMATQAVGNIGRGQPHNNLAPYCTLNFIIAIAGTMPPRD
jgi:microcystin-dependent protein